MVNIINYLLIIIQVQQQLISYLCTALVAKSFVKKKDKPVNKPYRKLVVDQLPVFEKIQKYDYQALLKDHMAKCGKPLKPVKRQGDNEIPRSVKCPCCLAPHDYIYDNNKRGQYLCKVCKSTFNLKNRFTKEINIRCPHCSRILEPIKNRKFFDIYKCKNNDCSFYLQKLASMTSAVKKIFKEKPHNFKVRYIFRAFNIHFKPLSRCPKTPVSLPKIYVSSHTLGLVLTYFVNYGLSSRKTASIMEDIHGVKISHQTIINYANSVAVIVKPFVDGYPYELSDAFCGDETYIRVNGKWHYIFFFFDAVKKIILSYHVSPNRDTPSAIVAIDDVLLKLREIPKNLNFVVDGNPIYLLAQHFFAQHNIFFDVTQVIGLANADSVSSEYRPLKQIIERLNRTFKGNYRPTTGFQTPSGSVTFVTLFVAYFNFLRPHSSLERNVPVVVPELSKLGNMPARWCKLIQLSETYIYNQTA